MSAQMVYTLKEKRDVYATYIDDAGLAQLDQAEGVAAAIVLANFGLINSIDDIEVSNAPRPSMP